MTIAPNTELFDAAARAHLAVTVHDAAGFEGMRKAGMSASVIESMQ